LRDIGAKNTARNVLSNTAEQKLAKADLERLNSQNPD